MNDYLWYLTQKPFPFALFSDLEEEHKENIVEVSKEHEHDSGASPRRTGAGYGKPSFPVLPKEATVDLAKLAGKDSFVFQNFEVGHCLLTNSCVRVARLFGLLSYLLEMKVVRHLCVVNISAERGVKLSRLFANFDTRKSTSKCIASCQKRQKCCSQPTQTEDRIKSLDNKILMLLNAVPNQHKQKIESKAGL